MRICSVEGKEKRKRTYVNATPIILDGRLYWTYNKAIVKSLCEFFTGKDISEFSYLDTYRIKVWVQRQTNNAIKAGELVRPDSCEKCGKVGKTNAHHDDYRKMFDVRWLCYSCHGKISH